MKAAWIHSVLATVLLVAGGFPGEGESGEATPREADTREIRAHIHSIFEAYKRSDRASIDATHAKDWRGFIRTSTGIVRGNVGYMHDADKILASGVRLVEWQMLDFDIVYHGEVGVVSYIAKIVSLHGDARIEQQIRALDIYVRRQGRWEQVASNVSTHPDAAIADK
jgi:hypothetical protein